MKSFIYLSVIILIDNAVLAILGAGFKNKLLSQKPLWKNYLPALLLEIGVLNAINMAVHLFTATSASLVLGVPEIFIIVSAVTVGSLSLYGKVYPEWDRCIKLCGLAAILPFLLEMTLFNFTSYASYSRSVGQKVLSLAGTQSTGSVTYDGAAAVVTVGNKGGTITFTNIDSSVQDIYLKTNGLNKMRQAIIRVKDSSNAETFLTVNTERFIPADPDHYFTVSTGSTIRELQIEFNDTGSSFALTSASINTAKPFHFCLSRYIGMVVLLWAIILVYEKRLWKIPYQPQSKKHKLAIAAVMICCMLASVSFLALPSKSVKYPLENSPDQYNPYIQQFDAFQKGQLNLDVKVDPKLQEMDNPYDPSARSQAGVSFQWDRAYYHGKYYSYFGVVPIFTVYYPYYLLTKSLPGETFVCAVLAIFSILFLTLFILTIIKLYSKRVNLLLLLLGLLSVVMSSCIYIAQSCSDFYYIAVLSGVCSASLFLFLSFYAYQHAHDKKRLLLFAAAGISFVLLVASRPVASLLGLVVVPAFLHILLNRDTPVRQKASCALSFLIPVFIGAAALMAYNQLRFHSPFEFGTAYQLTVSDISSNKLQINNIAYALFHYFFQPIQVSSEFPFINPTFCNLGIYGHYVYLASSVGAFAYPAVLSVWTLPALMMRSRDRVKKYTYLCMVVAAVLIALFTFSLGGVNLRYTADIMPILSVLSVLLIFECHDQIGRDKRLRGFSWTLAALLFCGSIIVGSAFVFSNEGKNILNQLPRVVLYFEKLFLFWN